MTGQPDAVQFEAANASVEEALNSLSASFDLRYRTADNLRGSISGSYAGSLQRVVSRILRDYDFVMETTARGIIVRVYGPSNGNVNTANLALGAGPTPTSLISPSPRLSQQGLRGRNTYGRSKNAAFLRSRHPPVE